MIELTCRVLEASERSLEITEVFLKAFMDCFAKIIKAQNMTLNWTVLSFNNTKKKVKATYSYINIAIA